MTERVFRVLDGGEEYFEREVQANEALELYLLLLAKSDMTAKIRVKLQTKACAKLRIALLAAGRHMVSVDYLAEHETEASESDFLLHGILADGATKKTRMETRFETGAHGAKGVEHEKITMLDESCRNQCLPIIYAAEEDISGEHGMSCGGIDATAAEYLATRGLSRRSILRNLLRSDISYVLDGLDDSEQKIVDNYFRDFCEQNHV